eukprot:CAMPEP_0196572340 /NCGR_PEP_ID=MMETSP1081-20130531/2409_1 /TAXON_ID=36882 /ORGANISM="Pyramimonas amylifera, Strain CCMP720" /LENGTH=120 /DNA_ID=CAMNT_0041889627 /DNA_START=148 /DNA_END=510 /DNA_ORIENTATION=+
MIGEVGKKTLQLLRPLAGKPNLLEIIRTLPDYGVGSQMKRTSWNCPDSYWTITKVRPKQDGRSGSVWGVRTWAGKSNEIPERIGGTLKKEWTPINEVSFVSVPARKVVETPNESSKIVDQ